MTSQLPSLDSVQLATVSGGAQFPNMGAPKYSAAWWDIVRSRGLDGGPRPVPVLPR